MHIFADRKDAGRQLAAAVDAIRPPDAVVLGIARGGIVVAAEVARALRLPLAAAVVRKLGAPAHEEYAIGAIAEGVQVVDEAAMGRAGVNHSQLAQIEARERAELLRRSELFAAVTPVLRGRTAIIVDDGVATGSTATAACTSARLQEAARIVLAVPVAPAAWRPDPALVDDYVCLHAIRDFWAVGQFYRDFTQATDEDVARALSDGVWS